VKKCWKVGKKEQVPSSLKPAPAQWGSCEESPTLAEGGHRGHTANHVFGWEKFPTFASKGRGCGKRGLANTFIPRGRRGAGLTFLQITVYTRPIQSYVKRHKEMKQDLHLRPHRRVAPVTESMSCDGKSIAHVRLAALSPEVDL
jgi:hypothetical protein